MGVGSSHGRAWVSVRVHARAGTPCTALGHPPPLSVRVPGAWGSPRRGRGAEDGAVPRRGGGMRGCRVLVLWAAGEPGVWAGGGGDRAGGGGHPPQRAPQSAKWSPLAVRGGPAGRAAGRDPPASPITPARGGCGLRGQEG